MKKVLLMLSLVLSLFMGLKLSVNGEASITSTDLTWSIYNPYTNVFYATSTKLNVDLSQPHVVNFISQTLATGATINLSSVNDSYSQTVQVIDLVKYNYNWVYLDYSTIFNNYGSETDYQVQFVIVYNVYPSITSSALASTHVNTYFGLYDSVYFMLSSSEIQDRYNAGYITGQNDMFENGSYVYGYYVDSYDYTDGYTDGQYDMYSAGSGVFDFTESESYDYEEAIGDLYTYGSDSLGLDPENSSDFLTGYGVGQSVNVNAGMTLFMAGFEKWIVPAIVLVLLLGGFITIYARKNKGSD